MKVALYTKIVLTAIAIGLFLNVMKTVSPMAALAKLGIPDKITIHHTGGIGQRYVEPLGAVWNLQRERK